MTSRDAQWLELAGIPNFRQDYYLAHGSKDLNALYKGACYRERWMEQLVRQLKSRLFWIQLYTPQSGPTLPAGERRSAPRRATKVAG